MLGAVGAGLSTCKDAVHLLLPVPFLLTQERDVLVEDAHVAFRRQLGKLLKATLFVFVCHVFVVAVEGVEIRRLVGLGATSARNSSTFRIPSSSSSSSQS